jgi:phosphoglycolate phosphatase
MERPLVVFDFDGTIADSFAESLAAYNRVSPRLRLRRVANSEVPELRRLGVGKLLVALGIPMWKLPRLMIAVRADLLDHVDCVAPVPGIATSIRALAKSGYRLAIVTSNSKANVHAFLARHDLEVFSTIVAGASIFGKATRLRRLLRTAAADTSTAVYVGDAPPDIRAGREAGACAIAVTWGFFAREPLAEEHPHALLESPDELPATILRLLENR